jgi:hypothetical protein
MTAPMRPRDGARCEARRLTVASTMIDDTRSDVENHVTLYAVFM